MWRQGCGPCHCDRLGCHVYRAELARARKCTIRRPLYQTSAVCYQTSAVCLRCVHFEARGSIPARCPVHGTRSSRRRRAETCVNGRISVEEYDMPTLRVKVADAQPAPAVRVSVEQTTSLADARLLILNAVDKPVHQPFWLSLDKQVWCMHVRK